MRRKWWEGRVCDLDLVMIFRMIEGGALDDSSVTVSEIKKTQLKERIVGIRVLANVLYAERG